MLDSGRLRDGRDDAIGVPDGKPWLVRVPTSLLVVDPDYVLGERKLESIQSWSEPLRPREIGATGKFYDENRWPDTRAVIDGLAAVGYGVQDLVDALAAKRGEADLPPTSLQRYRFIIRHFQDLANSRGLHDAYRGPQLTLDGLAGADTLRSLSVATHLVTVGSWERPLW